MKKLFAKLKWLVNEALDCIIPSRAAIKERKAWEAYFEELSRDAYRKACIVVMNRDRDPE